MKVELVVDSEKVAAFIRHFLNSGEIFSTPYGAGYWLCPVRDPDGEMVRNAHGALLVLEACDRLRRDERLEKDARAAHLFLKGETLPASYHAFDAHLARLVFTEAVRAQGVEAAFHADLPHLDAALQQALLGEQRYG